jgi:hypothetical protein
MRIYDKNVGIGTTSLTSSGGYSTLSLNGSSGGQISFQTGESAKQFIYSTSTDLNINNNVAGNLKFFTSGTERMRIDSSGNVGIGLTSNSTYPLQISASGTDPSLAVGVTTNTHGIIQILSTNTGAGTIHFGDSDSIWDGYISYGHSNQALDFGVNGATKMSLMYTGQSNGALRIGTTSVLASSPEKMSVLGVTGITVKTTSYANYAPLYLWQNGGSAGDTLTYCAFINNAGAVVGSITSVNTTTSYNVSSDYRLKENVDYTWDATTRLKQLKPARFNWIADETNTLVDGFLAHEVSSIVPEAITGVKDETETNENCILNAAGVQEVKGVTEAEWIAGKLPVLWTENDELPEGVSVGDIREEAAYASDTTWVAEHTQDVYQGIDQAKLVPLLVKTIQELEARITALES